MNNQYLFFIFSKATKTHRMRFHFHQVVHDPSDWKVLKITQVV